MPRTGILAGWIMAVITTVLVLALLSVSTTAKEHKGFWEYFSQSGQEKGRIEQMEQQKLSKEFLNLKANIEQDLSNVDTFLEKLEPLAGQGKHPLLFLDSKELQHQLHKELEEVRTRLAPYTQEVQQRVGWNLEGLRRQLQPYTVELMERLALGVQELQEQLKMVGEDTKNQLLGGMNEARDLLQKFQDQVAHHTGRVKALFHPYAERLVTGIGQHVQELHRNVAPHAATSPARLSHYIQALSKKLTLKAQALHTRIQDNLDQLRDELTAYAGAREDEDVGGLGQDSQLSSEELTKEVQQRLEAFRLDTFQEIADFTRAIDRETEELQQQLAPPPSAHNAFSPEQQGDNGDRKVLGELRSRLDALWEDIHYNLQDQGHGLSGTP
ncbi:apolipoprotein A-V isoform X1 [Trichosurus vulpecula]|uniref:apolipoprotein A-V isoform X1 n=2 Tax=Trichosurus vulpecula TaxID=9337 RepID=UPI00186B383A|nr:apolipoprotein A-V isoform X1 [Trichosurus vulpecula]